MKRLTIVLIVTLLTMTVAISSSAALADERGPEIVLQDFYKWYIIAVDKGTDPMKGPRTTLKKYVTLRLINQIAHAEARNLIDADSFVQTQEWDKEWANHVAVSNLNVKDATATAIVTFGNDNYPRVSVTLVKAAGIWKIDRVRDAAH